jgi:hypothetical protein
MNLFSQLTILKAFSLHEEIELSGDFGTRVRYVKIIAGNNDILGTGSR